MAGNRGEITGAEPPTSEAPTGEVPNDVEAEVATAGIRQVVLVEADPLSIEEGAKAPFKRYRLMLAEARHQARGSGMLPVVEPPQAASGPDSAMLG